MSVFCTCDLAWDDRRRGPLGRPGGTLKKAPIAGRFNPIVLTQAGLCLGLGWLYGLGLGWLYGLGLGWLYSLGLG